MHEERLLADVAIPDHEILTKSQISPERGEGEDQLADVMEMALFDQPVGGVQKAVPPEHEHAEKRERAKPSTHEEPPAVQRALEVQREAHRQIPAQHGPSEGEQQDHPDGEFALHRVRRVDLATLLAKSVAHPRAPATCPRRDPLRRAAEVEPERTID